MTASTDFSWLTDERLIHMRNEVCERVMDGRGFAEVSDLPLKDLVELYEAATGLKARP